MTVSKADQTVEENVITMDRRRGDRREGNPDAVDTGVMESPRRKTQRRRHIDPTTCERDYSNPEIEFMRAMDDYKRVAGRMFPTCSEVLEVIRSLGYYQLDDEQIDTLGLEDEEEVLQDAEQVSEETEEEFADA
ncbi:MAG: hypothetical protein ACR2NZ_23380 [Rubripirellula sp.]